MKLIKKQEQEIMQVYDTWMNSYLNGDIKLYDSFLDDDYRFIGSTNNEEFLNKKDTTNFLKATADQLAGKTEIRNSIKTIEQLDGLVFITDLFDAYFLNGDDWAYYGRFRFTSAMRKNKNGWRFIYQHFSTPDAKAQEGETLGTEQISKENQELRDAIQRRTVELEQKNRELEIETALEKVRAKSMAMYKSEELADLSLELVKQVQNLGVATWFCAFNIYDDDPKGSLEWGSNGQGTFPKYRTPREGIFLRYYKAGQRGESLLINEIGEKECPGHYEYLCSLPGVGEQLLQIKAAGVPFPTSQIDHVAFFKYGYILFITFEPAPEAHEIFKRFAKVFEQTYTRFLDLQKAEAQAREAQIEATLERIRARSMAMHSSEELNDVLRVMFQQIEVLGIDAKCAHLTLMDVENNKFSFRITGKSGAANIGEQIIDLDAMSTWRETVANWKKAKPHSHQCLVYPPEILPDLWKLIDESLKTLPVKERIKIKDFPNGVFDCEGHTKFGYIGFNNSRPPTEEEISIVIRFAREFERVYQRFLDIKKAEAQAREAQIEMALEKVRSRTMAMQNSSELPEAANNLFLQVQELGIPAWSAGYCIWEDDQKSTSCNMSSEGEIQKSFSLPTIGEGYNFYKPLKNKEPFHVAELGGKALVKHYDFMKTLPGIGEVLEDFAKKGIELPTFQIFHIVYFTHGYLMFITYETVPNDWEVFKRFGKVFEQTYTRFLDLKKAEAQAKEAQIEAALERVRSRSMAMHKSDELKDVVKEIFDQMAHLKINADHAGIVVDYEPKKDFNFWVADKQNIPAKITVPYLDLPWDKQFTEAKKKGTDFFTTQLNFEEKNSFYKKLLPHIKGLTKKAKDYYLNCPGLGASTVIQKDIGLYIENFSGIPFSDAENSILMRFGKVFQQTHTRFLDLQKAEAQAREAQIENALEKVRSRTMAMQNSSELPEAANNLFLQVQELGIPAWSAGYCIWEDDQKSATAFMSSEGVIQKPFVLPNIGVGYNFSKPLKKGEVFHVGEIGGNLIKKHYEFMRTLPIFGEVIDGILEAGHPLPTFQIFHICYFKYGYVMFITYETVPKAHDIFKRFAKVFEQTYTRFLDLQKAEAQAKEAQIEHALEKVRSRSLGMQNTKEMQLVANEIREQLLSLGLKIDALAMSGVIDNEADYDVWVGGAISEKPLRIPYNNDTQVQRDYNEVIKERPELFTKTYSGKIMKAYFKRLMATNTFNPEIEKYMLECAAFTTTLTFMKNSGIQIIRYSAEPFSDSNNSIVTRFGKVFEQAYIRFLDLQKAEAQAREAQIETALERVRSQSMGMQTSEDLSKVTTEMFNQLRQFNADLFATGIVFCDKDKGHIEQWHSVPNAGMMSPFIVPIDLDYIHQYRYDQWKKGTELFSIEIPSDFIDQHFNDIFKLPSAQVVLKEFEANKTPMPPTPNWEIDYGASFKHGYLLVSSLQTFEEAEILPRFAKVFEQTYTRFLDLQKAETQAREAQIQLSLERVRAKSMAMQSSDELHDVLSTLFQQFDVLGINPVSVFLSLFDREKRTLTYRASGKSGKRISGQQTVSMDSLEVWSELFDKWKNDNSDEVEVIFYSNEILPTLFELLSDTFASMPKEERMTADDFPDGGYTMHGYTPFGYIGYNHTREATEEEKNILTRFATEFSMVYQRFLDIQKAEAQAREAQIEAALEKVRSRTMAMQKGEEVKDVVVLLYKELIALGVTNFVTCGYVEINEETQLQSTWVTSPGGDSLGLFYLPLTGDVYFDKRYKAWKKQQTVFHQTVAGKERRKHLEYAITTFNSKEAEEMVLNQFPDPTVFYCFNFSHGYLHLVAGSYLKEEEEALLARFTKVFEQTYARFLDLEKAEAQAREAQIENALEKVRSRSLAMHKPEELQEVVAVVAEKLQELGVILDAGGVILNTYYSDSMDVMHWIAAPDFSTSGSYYFSYFDHVIFNDAWESKNRGDKYFSKSYTKEEKNSFLEYAFLHTDYKYFPEEFKDWALATDQYVLSFAWAKNSAILIPSHTGVVPSEEDASILKRFARVFEQAYIRFMDLQKAEAQAREAQIEAALEKVRSRSMAMHESKEMLAVIGVVSQQLQQLDLNFDTVSFAKNNQEGDFTFWITSKGQPMPILMEVPTLDSPVLKGIYKAQKEGITFLADVFSAEVNRKWHEHLIKYSDLKHFPDKIKDFILNAPGFARSSFLLKNIDLYVGNYRAIPFTEEENSIFRRFAHVFEQSYTRFLDLQKAEAQARESQIEVALERVRSRAMAMHHSDELTEVLGILFDQFDFLGINPVLTHLTLMDEENETFTLRITRGGKDRTIAEQRIDINAVESWKVSFANWKKSEMHAIDCIDYPPDILPFVWELMDEVMSALPEGQKIYPSDFPDGLYTTQGHCKYGYIGFNHTRRATEEEKEIVVRFAKEFARLYQRFLDIQKAENQAREAQIEGALERVRSKTMAMHNSEDLEDIVVSLFEEVMNLGHDKSIRCGIGILEGHEGMQTRSVNSNSDGTIDLKVGMLNMAIHPMLIGLKKAWKNGRKGYSYEYTAKDVRKYYEALNNEPEYPFNADLKTLPKQEFHRSFFFSSGIIFAFSENPISEESSKILARFAAVFGQTYRRFLDLQKAEAQAREATKQASLDRVRGQIASMRSTDDLDRITPLVWNELTTMGVPFIRCGVFIMDEPTQMVEVYLSAPDGHSLGVLHLKFNADPLTKNTVAHWRKGRIFKKHWNREDFLSWTQSLIEQGQISDKNTYQGAIDPPESLDLHFMPFTQGMLYVGSEHPLVEEHIELAQSLADAFAIAYARYEDFTKLEKAKQSVEATLIELKATQNQLVQSEKMASLGELTAGIAHEIQNPLNFVNNFSEVSGELIEEMNEEIEKGDMEEAKAIANDVKQNLEKILHHGKRADAIVKGMLQHSRSSTGVKEPTDINVLADEYLRLAYHGLRAKDKSFNATMNTDYDDSLEKINVIPQDIGRVILNLITNAFYVVDEKKKQLKDGYEPTVSVSTKKGAGKIEISVKDNGNGIPDKVKEKIFQPFFTTKPTGKGTGLGLSMSYDIITKGHGGELKVETTEGEGTTFTIVLPMV